MMVDVYIYGNKGRILDMSDKKSNFSNAPNMKCPIIIFNQFRLKQIKTKSDYHYKHDSDSRY